MIDLARSVHEPRSMSGSIHVLLVDDDPLTIINLKRALGNTPEIASITVATDGLDALELLRGGTLASERLLMITDLAMPRMSGLELLAEIRADVELSNMPVVVLTTSSRELDRRAAFGLQVAGYFIKRTARKPFDQMLQWMRSYWSSAEFAPSGVLGN
jgi:CheY-like chemotaxis protein